VHALGGIAGELRQHVAVGAEREMGAGVAEQLLDEFEGRALGQEQRRAGVAQIVQA
jgi:hypothetical protein